MACVEGMMKNQESLLEVLVSERDLNGGTPFRPMTKEHCKPRPKGEKTRVFGGSREQFDCTLQI